jgi:hypothetical protein
MACVEVESNLGEQQQFVFSLRLLDIVGLEKALD